MTSRNQANSTIGRAAVVAALCAPAGVAAQGFDVQQFRPAASQSTNAFTVHTAEILTGGAWELGLMLNYADDPLVVREADSGDRIGAIVSSQLALDILGAVGIGRYFEIGVDVPLLLLQRGEEVAEVRGADGDQGGFGLGSIRVIPTVSFFDHGRDGDGGPALALVADVLLPTGDDQQWQGEAIRVNPQLAFDYAFRQGTRLALNAGAMIRSDEDVLDNLDLRPELTWGLGAVVPVALDDALHVVGEVRGAAALGADELRGEELPTELRVGMRYLADSGLVAELGGGTGLVNGAGTPDFRLFAGVAFRGGVDDDRDGDGLPNDVDMCPIDPEDFDGFQDDDGCPDVDNDEDGIRDTNDECPNDPEDRDDFEDENGCPDPDNDADGILDVADQCPNDPEDADAFEDENGCPDPDNDADGILDAADACPNEPEDMDGFEDENGCPDPDNDRDGILDVNDACPNEPEDFDGFEDENGCPEEGEGLVALTCDAIEIRESVFFDTDSDVIQSRSYPLLDQIAGVMRAASYIRLVRVEGHTDARGSDDYNLDLSNRRAASVRAYLVNAGIAAERLDSAGYGETQPIADNGTAEGRATNRRVDFRIVEQDSTCGQ